MELKEFIEKFAEVAEIENSAAIKPDTKFRDLDEWSSLSTLSVIAMADEEFDFELSPEAFRDAQTVEDLYKLCTEGH